MSLFRVVFFGTPDFAVEPLRVLAADEHFRIELVVSQPDRPAGRKMQLQESAVKKFAKDHGIPVETTDNVNTPEFLERLRRVGADAAVVVAFGQILSNDLLSIFPLRAVNLHASLLPRWRGAAPIQRALTEGDSESGVSLQIIVPKLDAGPVLGAKRVILDDQIDAAQLYSQLKLLGGELLKVEFCDYLRGNLMPVPQDESQITIAKKIKKEEGLIDWTQSASKINNLRRGLSMWPGVWTLRHGKTLKIISARVKDPKKRWTDSGVVMEVGTDFFTMACGEGSLEVLEVQPESRGRMSASEYARGYALVVGERLGS